MTKEEQLAEMIKNRSTEVQQCYYSAKAEAEYRIETVKKLNAQLAGNKKAYHKAIEMMQKCKQRAAEQGYPNLFDDQ